MCIVLSHVNLTQGDRDSISLCSLCRLVCSAYVLKLEDVINHLFGVETFARFAGTRTRAFLDSDFYHHLDGKHGGAISAMQKPEAEALADAGAGMGGSPMRAQSSGAHAHDD